MIQVDFTGGLEIYETIEAGLKDLEIGVLGMSLSPLGEALLSVAPTPPTPGLTLTPEHSPGRPLWQTLPFAPARCPWDCWSDTSTLSPLIQ